MILTIDIKLREHFVCSIYDLCCIPVNIYPCIIKYYFGSYYNKHILLQSLITEGVSIMVTTVKPVCNDHLYNKIHYLWFIQECVLMKTEGTNLLLLTISALWSSFRWPLAICIIYAKYQHNTAVVTLGKNENDLKSPIHAVTKAAI